MPTISAFSETQTIPAEENGDFTIIGGNLFPSSVGAQRRKLDARIKRDGFSQVTEAVAYTIPTIPGGF